MDIRNKILEIRTAQDKTTFVDYFITRPTELDEMMQCIFNLEEYPVKEYASWILIHVSQSRKIELQQYYPKSVDLLFLTDD